MAQIQKGTNYVLGDTVTPTNLNAHVDSAVLLPGAITDQSLKAAPVAADSVLLHSTADSALRKATVASLGAGLTAARATQLDTARTLALTGAVEGSASFDGTSNLSITTTFGSATVPPGSVLAFAAVTAPAGYLACNGALVSRSTYAALFAAVGTTYGVGDGATTFALPDLRGEFVRGWDNGRGVDAGRALGSAQADELEAHTHAVSTGVSNNQGGAPMGFAGSSVQDTLSMTSSATGGTETRPRNVALLYIIKT